MKTLSIMRLLLKNKFRSLKMKVFMLLVVIFGLYSFLSYILLEVWLVRGNSKVMTGVPVKLDYVVLHIDLKGTPLQLSYLESLLPMLKENGVNSLLMEYEDMFPYGGKLVNLSAENCYKKSELQQFLYTAAKYGFEIIPLVQTFGHMEFVLKLPEFQHLREDPLYPDSICPSKMESMALTRHMIEQVMDFHKAIVPLKHIHIGCDEVFHINKCQHCRKRDLLDMDIFLHHVKTLSNVIKSQYAETTVLIWDDMLRRIRLHKWNNIEQFANVQPVYWDYRAEILVSHANLFKYRKYFKHIWIASAYKGADGQSAIFPDLKNRYQNVFNWMNFISNYKFGGERNTYDFKGIILTGWSRYSHMDPPCELLPVSIPSLIIHLMVIQKFKSGIIEVSAEDEDFLEDFFSKHIGIEAIKSLNCVVDIDNFDDSGCEYDGRELYDLLKLYTTNSKELIEINNDDELGLTYVEYYSKFHMINMNTLAKNREIINRHLEKITFWEKTAFKTMLKYYANDFASEYINYKTFYLKRKIRRILKIYDEYQNVSVWKRRPKNTSYFIVE